MDAAGLEIYIIQSILKDDDYDDDDDDNPLLYKSV